ncbi:uncharacterized protein [Dysidea avara]|uniref:uncharacterized protein n=1 Tax=Dysidea avara TaxID=196820 RepID=UPI00331E0482
MAGIAFLQKYQATAISGWKEIYEHLGKILGKCEIGGKGCDYDDPNKGNYTMIQYESLTIKIYGRITEDDTLTILSKWEYYHIIEYARKISLLTQVVNAVTIQHQKSGTTYQFGLVDKGPWKPLKSGSPILDTIIWVSGSDDYKDVELFNGWTNLYLQAHKVGYGYKLKVADRPLETDLLRFDLSDPTGTIRLVANPNYYLKFDSTHHHVDVTDASGILVSSAPEFHFNIQFV